MILDIFFFFLILMLRYMILVYVWRAPLYRSRSDVIVLSQSGEMAWNLPQHPSRHPGSAERLGKRRPFRGGRAGSSQTQPSLPHLRESSVFSQMREILWDFSLSLSCDTHEVPWHWSTSHCLRVFLIGSSASWLTDDVLCGKWRIVVFAIAALPQFPFDRPTSPFTSISFKYFFLFHLIFSCNTCNGTHLVTNVAHVFFFFSKTAFLDHILPFSQCCQSLFSLSVEDHRQHQGKSVQHGHLCSGLAGGPRPHAGKGWEGEAPDNDPATSDAAVWRKHSTVL